MPILKLPDYNDPIKKDLADIAEKMSALKTDAETRMNRKYSDSADYFTLWAHQIKTPHSRYEAAAANRLFSGKRRA